MPSECSPASNATLTSEKAFRFRAGCPAPKRSFAEPDRPTIIPRMLRRLLLAAATLAVPALADVVGFENVEYHDKNIESGKVKNRDGMFHLDRDTGVFVFTADNRVWVTIPSRRVTSVTYDDKKDRTLIFFYNDARERQREASFKLKGGNRENILNVVNSETENKLVRVMKK